MKKSKEEFVRVCPKCGSTNVEWRLGSSTWSIALSGMGSAAVFDVFTCRDCGYSSQIMPEFPKSKLDEVKSSIKNRDSNRNKPRGERPN